MLQTLGFHSPGWNPGPPFTSSVAGPSISLHWASVSTCKMQIIPVLHTALRMQATWLTTACPVLLPSLLVGPPPFLCRVHFIWINLSTSLWGWAPWPSQAQDAHMT